MGGWAMLEEQQNNMRSNGKTKEAASLVSRYLMLIGTCGSYT